MISHKSGAQNTWDLLKQIEKCEALRGTEYYTPDVQKAHRLLRARLANRHGGHRSTRRISQR